VGAGGVRGRHEEVTIDDAAVPRAEFASTVDLLRPACS